MAPSNSVSALIHCTDMCYIQAIFWSHIPIGGCCSVDSNDIWAVYDHWMWTSAQFYDDDLPYWLCYIIAWSIQHRSPDLLG